MRKKGFGFRVSGFGFRVSGFGFSLLMWLSWVKSVIVVDSVKVVLCFALWLEVDDAIKRICNIFPFWVSK